MCHHAVEFLLKGYLILMGILFYPINTDKDVGLQVVVFFIGKGNNVGIGVVIQVFYIYLKEIFITTENVVDTIDVFAFSECYFFQPASYFILIIQMEYDFFLKEMDLCQGVVIVL